MRQGRVADTDLMPRLVESYTEQFFSKLKKGSGFLKPNFGRGLNQAFAKSSKKKALYMHTHSCFCGSWFLKILMICTTFPSIR